MKGDTRNSRFRSIVGRILPFLAMNTVGYPESISGVNIGPGSKSRPPKEWQVNGCFGNTGPAKLRKYAKAIKRTNARTLTLQHIKGMARFGSRPLGRVRPIVTSRMARAIKRASYRIAENNDANI